jgi:hypothetical protein
MKRGKNKENWKTRTKGTKAQVGTHYIDAPHGNKGNLPKGLKQVTQIGSAVRMEVHTVEMSRLPTTMYTDKADIAEVERLKDEIVQGHDETVSQLPVIHARPDGTVSVLSGKHLIEAYRQLGYKALRVNTNSISSEAVKLLQGGIKDPLVGMGGVQTQVLRADVKGEV